MTRVTDLTSAVSGALSDGETVYLGGFTHLIPFAAGHEIIRQGYEDLHLVRATPDLVYDRLIAAGCASRVTFSWAGNPGVGSLRAFRRAVEDDVPQPIEIEEYSHYGLVSRLTAGAKDLPFYPLRSYVGTDFPEHTAGIRTIENPYTDPNGGDEDGDDLTTSGEGDDVMDKIAVVPPLKPDIAVVRAQRADESGNAQLWGILGEMVEAAFAADTVVLSVEELVDEHTIRSDPNRTHIPGTVVDYVVEEPYGSHPSYAQGYYDRDNDAYLAWDEISETHEGIEAWLDEHVYGVANHREYLEGLDAKRLLDLQPGTNYATPVDMGEY